MENKKTNRGGRSFFVLIELAQDLGTVSFWRSEDQTYNASITLKNKTLKGTGLGKKTNKEALKEAWVSLSNQLK